MSRIILRASTSKHGEISMQLIQSLLPNTDGTELSDVWNTKTPRLGFINVWMCAVLWPLSVGAFLKR